MRREAGDQAVAALGIDLGDRQQRDTRLDQGERDRGTRAAGAGYEGAPAAEFAPGLAQGGNHGDAIGHVAPPAVAGDAVQEIGRAEEAGALGRLVAMPQRRELVRNGDDDAVEVDDALGRGHEGVEIRGRHMDGDAHGVDPACCELGREPGRRLGLADGIADDNVKPGFRR